MDYAPSTGQTSGQMIRNDNLSPMQLQKNITKRLNTIQKTRHPPSNVMLLDATTRWNHEDASAIIVQQASHRPKMTTGRKFTLKV